MLMLLLLLLHRPHHTIRRALRTARLPARRPSPVRVPVARRRLASEVADIILSKILSWNPRVDGHRGLDGTEYGSIQSAIRHEPSGDDGPDRGKQEAADPTGAGTLPSLVIWIQLFLFHLQINSQLNINHLKLILIDLQLIVAYFD